MGMAMFNYCGSGKDAGSSVWQTREEKSYDYWTETQAWLVARGNLLWKKQATEE